MEDYTVWTLRPLDRDRVAIDIAAAHTTGAGPRSLALGRAALETFSVVTDVFDCSIVPIRCNFFSDYPLENDWRDRWRIGWDVKLTLGSSVPNSMFHFPFAWLHTPDPTWDGRSQSNDNVTKAVVYVGASNITRHDLSEAVATANQKDLRLSNLDFIFLPRLDGTKALVIRIEIEEHGFLKQLEKLDAFIRRLEASGLCTNWRQFL